MPYSHHSHSGQFCKHASGTLEDVVLEAIRQRFEIYGLTEHVPRYRTQDLYPEEKDVALQGLVDQFDAFVIEAHRLKAKYEGEITLLVGLETECISGLDHDALEELLTRHAGRIEYLVGSVHHLNEIPIDFDRATYERALASVAIPGHEGEANLAHIRMDAYLSSYFDAQHTLLVNFKPEVIGHIDLCRLYEPSLRFADYQGAYERLRRNIRFAIGYGALFEVNAAALRKGWEDAYPGTDVVEIIKEYGGRFTLSDDSHGPHAVGLNYARMAEYMQRVGIDELWVVDSSDALNDAGRPSRSRRVAGRWQDHPFWTFITS